MSRAYENRKKAKRKQRSDAEKFVDRMIRSGRASRYVFLRSPQGGLERAPNKRRTKMKLTWRMIDAKWALRTE